MTGASSENSGLLSVYLVAIWQMPMQCIACRILDHKQSQQSEALGIFTYKLMQVTETPSSPGCSSPKVQTPLCSTVTRLVHMHPTPAQSYLSPEALHA